MSENHNHANPCVLLADDDPVFRMMMRRFLEKNGYRVAEAADGKQAVQLFGKQAIDLALLDGDMPIMDGFAACAVIKQQQRAVPVLIVTAHDDHDSIDRAFEAGAADYIHKPIHWQLLLHRIHYLLQIACEIVERQQREAEMRKLTSALDQAGSSVLITDTHGTIQYVNQAFTTVTGYSADEAIGNNPRMLQSGKQSDFFYKQMWQALLQQHEWTGVLDNRCKDGTLYSERLNIRALRNTVGETISFIGVFADITAQIAMEAQLRQAQKMAAIGTLVGGIAHNFNNMLAGMNGRAEVVKIQCRNIPDSPAKAKAIDGINKLIAIGMEAGEMVQNLLTYAHKGIRHRKEVELGGLFRHACDIAAMGLAVDIHCKRDFCPLQLTASADGHQLQQVLINLINNARDAVKNSTPKQITVSLHYQNSADLESAFFIRHPEVQARYFACLQVADTGSGMTAEEIEQIFEPFFTTKEVGEGTGLGLSMARGAAEEHGGALEVQSQSGVGSTFSLWIPLLAEAAIVGEASAPHIIEHSPPSSSDPEPWVAGKVLLVDDNDMVRETTQALLESLGMEVILACDGDEAVALFEQHRETIALVVSDVVMPTMNGTIAVAKMREMTPKLPVVFITGYDKSEVEIAPRHANITTVLSKPFRVEELLESVQTLATRS